MLSSVKTTLTQLGVANGLLYLLAIALARVSANRIRLYRYLLVAQPIPHDSAPMCRPAAKNPIREVTANDPIVARFPRPPQVIAKRFADGATCLVAEAKERFAGFLWLAHGGCDEDEVRCRYEFARPEQSVWDFDVYVEPEFRIGRTFSRLWDEANRRLRTQGVRWSYSRISAFNPNSLSVHGRMGARKLFSATFLCIGPVQITLAGNTPYLHLSLSDERKRERKRGQTTVLCTFATLEKLRRTKLGAGKTAPSILLALLLATSLSAAHAATLRVGPGENFTRIADAARLAKDGDTVEILPGEYRGDVAVWPQKQLTIRGIGPRPVLIADGKSAEGKAIWVIRNGDFRIENIEFRGTRVSDRNGAGIRFERGKLTVRQCAFIDNQTGLLTSGFKDAELTIENSEFSRNGTGDGQTHNLYVGAIAKLAITGSRFHAVKVGHLIKSRARQNDIRYNFIYDGPEGTASYEVEFPNGGVATLVGNIIGQSATTQNPVVVSYGAEGKVWPDNSLTLIHNTLINDHLPGAWFLRVHKDKFTTPPKINAINNLTVGLGIFTLGASGEFHGNLPALSFMLTNPQTLDFGLPQNSPLRWLGTDTVNLPDNLKPAAEFTLPIGARPLIAPVRWAAGAIQ